MLHTLARNLASWIQIEVGFGFMTDFIVFAVVQNHSSAFLFYFYGRIFKLVRHKKVAEELLACACSWRRVNHSADNLNACLEGIPTSVLFVTSPCPLCFALLCL